jgi:hypothetical protein
MTVLEVTERDKIAASESPTEDRVAEVWPWQIMFRDDGTFSFFLNLEVQEGTYQLHVVVRDRRDSIPYDYPVEGLSLPGEGLIKAATVMLDYDGRLDHDSIIYICKNFTSY